MLIGLTEWTNHPQSLRANQIASPMVNLDLEFRPGTPLRGQLEHALRGAIRTGQLQAGALLPPSRALAQQLGVSRGVVVDTYSQLAVEGYLSARQGSGTRVARLPADWGPSEPRRLEPPPRYRYDLRPGVADFHAFPRGRWRNAVLRAMRDLPDLRLSYGNHRGAAELRTALAEHMARRRGVVVEPERVVICCGASHALSVMWRALHKQGARRVAIEDPSWRWQRLTVENAGLEAVPVSVDQEGLVVSELTTAGVDAVVVTPAHQYPTAVVMSATRRRELVDWARERGKLIVEDDYDAEHRYDRDPVSALQGLAPDRVAYVGTVSKTLAPALRLAWLVPPERLVDDVEQELLATGATPPTIDQIALAAFIADAGFERHLRRMRARYRDKRAVLVESLGRHIPGARIQGVAAGLHLLAWLPTATDERRTASEARAASVCVHELHRHCTTVADRGPAFIIGFAFATENEIRTGVRLLAESMESIGG
jgi:GntR family transcriptional regulator / MocR family aminotransferase